MPPNAVHFNGGVNLPDAETVFREIARRVPRGIRRLPDGEPGERAGWIGFQASRLLETPGLERVEAAPTPGEYGVGRPGVRLVAGTDPDTLAWPDLRYAAEYQDSYALFRRLRDAGVVPSGVRFQVEYPTPHAVCRLVEPDDRAAVEPSYTRALLADLGTLLAAVPHDDLAVQWDVARETSDIEMGRDTPQAVADTVAGLADQVPDDVPVGLHLCYGDFGHQHFMQPVSLRTQVHLGGLLAARVRRPLAWISFTVPQDRGDRDYFAPLADLAVPPETELYFALVPYHPDAQAPGTTEAQVALVDELLPGGPRPWGVCTECGMARADRDDISRLLDLHAAILERCAG